MNLRAKFCLSVLALVGLVVVGVGAMTLFSEKQTLESESKARQQQLVNQLAKVTEESLIKQDDLILFNYLKTLQNERGFDSALFADQRSIIQSHSNPSKIGSPYNLPVSPIISVEAPVQFGGKNAGRAVLLLDQNVLNSFIRRALARTTKRVLGISLVALLFGLAGALWLSKNMVSPIRKVVDGMNEIAHGRLKPLPDTSRRDELGWLTKEMNLTIEKLRELEDMKREFTASVTHELRSPLTAIERFVSLMLKKTYGPITNEQQDSLMTIKNNTLRLNQFVDDLLTTAKIEAKKIDLFNEEFDIREIVLDVQKFLSSIAKEKKLFLKAALPKTSVVITADKEKTTQIISNLVSNALKYTTDGGVTIELKEDKKNIQISVQDSGPGIEKSEQKKIFDKFYRSPSTAQASKGTGLGLSIVKSFTELQKGKITYQPNTPKGSNFILTLPK